jgi:hypothetical protein
VQRLDISKLANPVAITPGEEGTDRPVLRHASVLVADGGRKKLQKAPGGVVTGIGGRSRAAIAAEIRLARVSARPAGWLDLTWLSVT